MDLEQDINLNELSKKVNLLRDLEAQEEKPEPLDEYLNMDKETIIRFLLASQQEAKRSEEENRKLHEKIDEMREESRNREDRLMKRLDEMHDKYMQSMDVQVRQMDQLTELTRQLKQMGNQYDDLLVELKRQKDLNKIARKEKYDTTKH
ncbi:hypothetical protein [Segatella bryantii]|uniref:hypothetical protein n=1 Tax=Segatella bryantii TaxID=77095 RepID=UPI00241F5EB1|nr:hypothetical protein [Segatella bryantii]